MAKLVRCPHCKIELEYSIDNEYRPFCSKRCKWTDLGKWAEEEYKVPEENPAQNYDPEDPEDPQHLSEHLADFTKPLH